MREFMNKDHDFTFKFVLLIKPVVKINELKNDEFLFQFISFGKNICKIYRYQPLLGYLLKSIY